MCCLNNASEFFITPVCCLTMLEEKFIQYLSSPIGLLKIVATAEGIAEVNFVEQHTDGENPSSLTQQCAQELQEYFDGQRQTFTCKLNPEGTAFQQKVWQLLHTISCGQTATYLQQSQRLGDVKAIRAVGNANGKNPIAIIIPCHRVIGTNGKLVGYAGGAWRKQWLLEHERYISTGFKKLL